jgi:hypothetical protein
VGDGRSIRIWEDQWLPHSSPYTIQSPIRILPPTACVSELIDNETRWWNSSLIRGIFTETEANRICSLAISPGGQPDKIIWRGTSSGMFTVRSAYHLEKERCSRDHGESSTAFGFQKIWPTIWKLHLPGVVKSFLWRVCNNLLPTKLNLLKKMITSDPLCPLCGLCTESTGHAIWGCNSAKAVWMECSRKIQKLAIDEDDGLLLFWKLFDTLEEEDLLLVSCLARQIWLRRNSIVFGGTLSSPTHMVKSTMDFLTEFHAAQLLPPTASVARTQSVRQLWRRPPEGVVKVNWDAALDKDTKMMGVGVIVRDERGDVLATLCTTIPFVTDPTIAEAIAAWKAVELGCELGFQRVILEGDALEIVKALRQAEPSWSRYGQLIEDASTSIVCFHPK